MVAYRDSKELVLRLGPSRSEHEPTCVHVVELGLGERGRKVCFGKDSPGVGILRVPICEEAIAQELCRVFHLPWSCQRLLKGDHKNEKTMDQFLVRS